MSPPAPLWRPACDERRVDGRHGRLPWTLLAIAGAATDMPRPRMEPERMAIATPVSFQAHTE